MTRAMVETASARHFVDEADMFFKKVEDTKGRSQGPRSLRRGPEAARLWGLRVRKVDPRRRSLVGIAGSNPV